MAKTSLRIQPTAGYIIVEQKDASKKTASGIYLPEASSEKPQRGKVLAVGETEVSDHGAKKESPVKVGDEVIFKKWGGNEVKVDGVEYMFVKFDDILAIIK